MSEIIFTTERLTVRTWTERDRPALKALLGDPITMAHWPEPLDDERVGIWLEWSINDMARVGYARWCVERTDDGQIVGDVGIRNKEMFGEVVNDLGYIIAHPYWQLGYGHEAAAGAVRWAKDQGLDEIVANMATDNAASVAMAEKLGMTREREFLNPHNLDQPTYWYRLVL